MIAKKFIAFPKQKKIKKIVRLFGHENDYTSVIQTNIFSDNENSQKLIMVKFIFSAFFVIFSIAFAIQPLQAQGWEFGGTLGAAFYRGDLDVNASNFVPQSRPMIGVFGRYELGDNWALRTDLNVARIFVSEKYFSDYQYRKTRGFSFGTNFLEMNLQLQWLPIRLWDKVSFYGIGGVGIVSFDPKPKFNLPNPYLRDNDPNLMRDKAANYSRTSIVIPLGSGMRIDLGNDWVFGTEMSMRKTFTDYLDGISHTANPKTNDYYFFMNLLLSKKFGGGGSGYGRRSWSSSYGRGGKVRCYRF